MKRIALVLVLAVLAVSLPQAQDAERLFKAAMNTELVDGNLKSAIEQYSKVTDGPDRALAVKALVRIAECYQKLGDAQAKTIYERIVRDYADQKDAVTLASGRLGRGGEAVRPVEMTLRKIWAGSNVDTGGSISPDGRYLSYVDWDTGDLAVHDFAAGSDRRLTNKGTWMQSDEFAEQSAISRDGRQVAYAWFNGKDRYEIRAVDLEASGIPQSRRIFDNPDVEWLAPHDWSPDGRWLAVAASRIDRSTQIGLVDVRAGSWRALKSVDWRGVTRMFFSPDGKYLAFDLPAGDRIADKTDVVVMAVDGSIETTVAPSPGVDAVMGWSPDGTKLLVASDRGGTTGLWAQRFENGKAQGPLEIIKSDIGHRSLGLSAAGKLFVGVQVGDMDIHVASVDFKTGRLLAPPSRPAQSFIGTNRKADWSPDGRFLSYVSGRGRLERNSAVMIRSIETGEIREVVPSNLASFYSPEWAPDGRSMIVQGTDLKGRRGVYRIDIATGDTTPLLMSEPGKSINGPIWSRDGKKLFYRLGASGETAFIERDLGSGTERDVIRRKRSGPVPLGAISLSPDGTYIATRHDPDSKTSTVLLIPVSGAEPRELLRVNEPYFIQGVHGWAPGGREVIAARGVVTADEVKDILLVPIAGGAPRTLEVPGFRWGGIPVHPDGRQIAYLAGKNGAEVWVLENFLVEQKR